MGDRPPRPRQVGLRRRRILDLGLKEIVVRGTGLVAHGLIMLLLQLLGGGRQGLRPGGRNSRKAQATCKQDEKFLRHG